MTEKNLSIPNTSRNHPLPKVTSHSILRVAPEGTVSIIAGPKASKTQATTKKTSINFHESSESDSDELNREWERSGDSCSSPKTQTSLKKNKAQDCTKHTTEAKVQEKKLTPTETCPPTNIKKHVANEGIPQKRDIIDFTYKYSQRSILECNQLITNKTLLNKYLKEFEESRKEVYEQQTVSVERFVSAKMLCMEYLERLRKITSIRELRLIVKEMNDNQGELLNFGTIELICFNSIKDKYLLIEELKDYIEDFEEWEKDYIINMNDKLKEILKVEVNLERLAEDYNDFMISINDTKDTLSKCMQVEVDKAIKTEKEIEEVNKQQRELKEVIESINEKIKVIGSYGISNRTISSHERIYKNLISDSKLEQSKFNNSSNSHKSPQLKSSNSTNSMPNKYEKYDQSLSRLPLENSTSDRGSNIQILSTTTIPKRVSKVNSIDKKSDLSNQTGKFNPSIKSKAWEMLRQYSNTELSKGRLDYYKIRSYIRTNSIIIIDNRLWKDTTMKEKEFIVNHSKHLIWDDRFPQSIENISEEEDSLLIAPQILAEHGVEIIEDLILLHPYEIIGVKECLSKELPGINIEILTSLAYPRRITSMLASLALEKDQVDVVSRSHWKIEKFANRSTGTRTLNKKQYFFGEFESLDKFVSGEYTVIYESEFREFIGRGKRLN